MNSLRGKARALMVIAPVLALAQVALAQGDVASSASRAEQLARELLIVDTHIDVPYRLHRTWQDVSKPTADGDFDHPRAQAGGLDAAFMSIYIPAAVDAEGGAAALADKLIDSVERIARNAPDKFALATCADDLMAIKATGRVALPLGMENGGPIGGDFANLRHFHERGIRYVTLAHSRSNHISDSSYDPFKRWQGLSHFGKRLVAEMNRLGTMIDVSHLSDQAFWQVIELSRTPVIASHSSLRHFTPGFERNMSDEMVAALGRNGGVIQISFGSVFLTPTAIAYSAGQRKAAMGFAFNRQLNEGDARVAEFMAQYRSANPYPYATLDDALNHFDRAVALAGIEAVGVGSDYDGVGDSLPVGLKDASTYPNLIQGLLGRGYSEQDIAKILGGNLMRAWRAVEVLAESNGNPPQCSATAAPAA
ncbi:MAG: dipeptidase [Gammaproteobacteria bacterium]|nr:dipeptidase [Gammaproteobacteria bacterium]